MARGEEKLAVVFIVFVFMLRTPVTVVYLLLSSQISSK